MNRVRRPPLQHPLALCFEQAIDSLGAALHPETVRHYRGTARNFLKWLGVRYPDIHLLNQLQRNPHVLGWLAHLHSQSPPLATPSYINLLIHMRGILYELAWTEQLPELAHLLRREDVPRMPQRLPRPLTAEQDQILGITGNSEKHPVIQVLAVRSKSLPPLLKKVCSRLQRY